MIKKVRLSKKSVKAYEEYSGFKTTGKVYLQIFDKKTMTKIDYLIDTLFTPK